MKEMKLLGNLMLKAFSAPAIASIDGGAGGVNDAVLALPPSPNIFFRKLMARARLRNYYLITSSGIERARWAENDGSEDGRARAFRVSERIHQRANFRRQFHMLHGSGANTMA